MGLCGRIGRDRQNVTRGPRVRNELANLFMVLLEEDALAVENVRQGYEPYVWAAELTQETERQTSKELARRSDRQRWKLPGRE